MVGTLSIHTLTWLWRQHGRKLSNCEIVTEVTAGKEEGSVDCKDGNDEGEAIVNPGFREQEKWFKSF